MKYKVGDKVKIREDLVVGNTYDTEIFVQGMEQYKGKTATIDAVVYDYRIDIDNNKWRWSDEMFEDVKEVDDNEQARTVDVGFHLDYCGHRVLKDVWQGETGINRHYYTKNYDTQYIIPIDAIDFIIPHED